MRDGEEGFDFLGFHHRMVESWKRKGHRYLQKWPSTRAMASVKASIRARTARSQVGRTLNAVVADLNPVIRGWGNYFRYGNSARKFAAVDEYVRERLAKLDSRKRGRRACRWNVHTVDWFQRIGLHQLSGTVRYWAAHA